MMTVEQAVRQALDELALARVHRKGCKTEVLSVAREVGLAQKTAAADCACIADLQKQRAQKLAAGKPDIVGYIDDKLIKARIQGEVSQTALQTHITDHAAEVESLRLAQVAVEKAALAVCEAERSALAAIFMVDMARAVKSGENLRFFTGSRQNLPTDVELALQSLPRRDDIYTPVNILRGFDGQGKWDARLAALCADDEQPQHAVATA